MARSLIFAAGLALAAASSLPGSWSSGPPLPVARSEVAVASMDSDIYVIGGYANDNVDQTRVDLYRRSGVIMHDRSAWHWYSENPIPRGLNHIGAVGFKGKIFTFGGFSAQNNGAVADANVYDRSARTWKPIAPMPHPLGSVSVTVLGDEIHLVGGRDVHSVTTHYVYDPVTNRYFERAPLPVGRDHMGLVGYNGKLYAIGGRIDTPAHNTNYVDIYDPSTNSWSIGARMPSSRSGMAVAVYKDKIFAIGGEQSGMRSAFTTNEAYDPATNRWSEYAPLPEGRHGTGAVVIDDRLYVPAGASVPGGTHQTNTLLIFTL